MAKMTDSLKAKLAKAGVDDDTIIVLGLAMKGAETDFTANIYARAMEISFDEHGLVGVKTQVLYILSNLSKWRGEEARASKKILNRWIST